MIDFELYKIFVNVANEENITRASKILNISQPAVTKHIKNLESELGIILFERSNKGLKLTEKGSELYEKLKQPISEIMYIDRQFGKIRNINLGSHNHLFAKVFGTPINEFYLKYPDVNLNLTNDDTYEMLRKLNSKMLDIVFSKKVESTEFDKLKYIKLGELNDVFISSKKANFKEQILTKQDIKDKIIYVPRTYSQTVYRLKELMKGENLNLKHSSYSTILELVGMTQSIGLITKEYVDVDAFDKYNVMEIKTELKTEPVEFGIYLNNESFFELRELVKIIKKYFYCKK